MALQAANDRGSKHVVSTYCYLVLKLNKLELKYVMIGNVSNTELSLCSR